MYKTVGIYRKMEDVQEFERFYISEFMPRMLKLPGVLEMKISKLVPTQLPNQDPGLQDIQLVVETYYESAETIRQLMATEEGRQLGSLLAAKGQGKIGAYVAQEYKVKSTVLRL
ncbi:EthD family reductase [Kroppenstedtia guangzhouensis]|nr:EthD family reductase [Kroppenstedtia guangzhouensis]